MKRTIIIEIILLIALSISIYFVYYFFNSVYNLKETIDIYSTQTGYDYSEVIQQLNESIKINSIYGTLTIVSSLANTAVITLIAIKDFPAFQPLRDKLSARKQARQQAKAEKAEEKKQETIKALEDYLDELKKE